MLAPYPDRLRSSRSTPAQNNANTTSAPSPPPPQTFPSTSSSTSHHRLFSSRSNLPSTRMRTNSLSTPSPPQSESPSSSTDFVLPTSLRNTGRRPHLSPRPSTSSGIPDKKHPPVVHIPVALPFSGVSSVPVSPLFTCDLSPVHHIQLEAISRFHTHS
jgi:hypothetical protein